MKTFTQLPIFWRIFWLAVLVCTWFFDWPVKPVVALYFWVGYDAYAMLTQSWVMLAQIREHQLAEVKRLADTTPKPEIIQTKKRPLDFEVC